ncbi:MAG: trigger factor [Coriobacteriia bacterium]|nr:trigger factor [Coriobacteriia bacterium]
METISKQLGENRIEVSVTIPAADVDKAVKAAYAEANKTRIKGFRVGKAPRNVLDNLYGGPEYFLVEATNEMVKDSYILAYDQEGLVPLESPEMGELEPASEGVDYQYSFTVIIAPELELESYDPPQIELPSDEPSDEEIQAKIDTMLGYYREIVDIDDRPSEIGDVLTLDMEVTNSEGERVEALSGEDLPYELGADAMPEDFEKHFMGINPGESLSIDFQLPFADAEEEGEEQQLHAEASVKKISVRQLPELTDEWVKEKLEYESAEHFRSLLADSLRVQKVSSNSALKERRIADELALRLIGEPPEQMITEIAEDVYRDFFLNLQQEGITLDSYLSAIGWTSEQFREDVQSQAETSASQTLALDAWARHVGITTTDEEIRAEFEASGVDDVEGTFQQWIEAGRLSEVRQGILRMKASRQLMEEAIVSEEQPQPDLPELAAEPGGGAEEEAQPGQSRKGRGSRGSLRHSG